MHSPGFPLHSWTGDETGWPEAALAQGAVRISGAVDRGASWHACRDRLGWTTVVLIGRPDGQPIETAEIDHLVRACADRCFDPLRTARALSHRFGLWKDDAELGVLRVGPRGTLVELLNVSLPAILQHDPHDGVVPFEALGAQNLLDVGATTEMVHLEPGGLLLAATRGVLPRDAGWGDLNRFVESLAIEQLGGQIADVPPTELARLMRTSWGLGSGPRAILAVGLPPAEQRVA
ncbi:MAG: hypothetical protein H6719_11435 [Sandaracinaceae bacterium]|nr:hypothetical protein [Sandaracinaceae bacterium]